MRSASDNESYLPYSMYFKTKIIPTFICTTVQSILASVPVHTF